MKVNPPVLSSLLFTATYDFLAIEDANKDKVMDVVFVLKEAGGSQNNTFAGEGAAMSALIQSLIHCEGAFIQSRC